MKKRWMRPEVLVENFVPNEYVATCEGSDYYANFTCAIPGSYKNYIGDGIGTVTYNWGSNSDGKKHGSCGETSETSKIMGATTTGGVGYEYRYGEVDRNRPIYNVSIGKSVSSASAKCSTNIGSGSLTPGYHLATWESTDGSTGNYKHYGIAYISKVVTQSNHS
ncbi:hypothetical protein [Eubacterium oxidoreducens]|uniref:Uncharacterized protein n=1 Tax=Eubacterium oxidoreducens TaxID=1732 RepID=A0A1G6B9N6_EUBOX|nr:hypothetical protein [Eubacterium oxidoreducens]SDB17337.1 hypothetical protein SAMN02910417_01262 [Eubacterium oxidoreducens]